MAESINPEMCVIKSVSVVDDKSSAHLLAVSYDSADPNSSFFWLHEFKNVKIKKHNKINIFLGFNLYMEFNFFSY